MATASVIVMVILVLGTLVVHSGNYYLRQQKDWRAKGLLILGWVLAVGIAAQYYFNYQLAAPRTLNENERNRITEKMKEFAGQEYTGRIGSGVVDAWELWREIGLSLDLAGWKFWCCVSRPLGRRYGHEASITETPNGAIWILWQGGVRVPPNDAPAETLAKALTAEGISAYSGPTNLGQDSVNHPNLLVIEIGLKPQK